MSAAQCILVWITAADREEAVRIGRAAVESRLAACCQVDGPIESCYWWKGRLETAVEWRCALKTRAALFPALEQAIRAAHSYDTPQIVATPIAAGSADYLAWLETETAADGGENFIAPEPRSD